MKNIRTTIKFWAALILPIVAVLLAIWLPFGFRLIGLIEEWDVLGLFVHAGHFFVADAGSPMAAHAIRPLTILPHALAYSLDPDSFDYWHVLLILALLIKGCASSHLIWKATGSLALAIVVGVLVLLYPADTMQLSFRAIHINWSLTLLLFASSIFVVGYEHKRKIISYFLCAIAAAFLFTAICMYEAALVLSPLPLLVIFIKEGFSGLVKSIRERFVLLALWMAGVGAYIIYMLLTIPKVVTYQASVFGGKKSIYFLVSSLPKLFSICLPRALFGGWYDASRMVFLEYQSFGYLIVAVAVLATGAMAALTLVLNTTKKIQNVNNLSRGRTLAFRLIIVGVFLSLLGYFPFLLSAAHQVISQRTFLWVAPGAAIFWGGVLLWISNRSTILAGLLSLSLLFLGLGAQLFQMHHYVQIGEQQRTLLRGIVENFDGNLEGKTLILRDGSNQLGHTWMFLPSGLPYALTYIYGHPINSVEICHSPAMEWQRADGLGRKGKCIEGENDWSFSYAETVEGPGYVPPTMPAPLRISKSKAVVLNINADSTVSLAPSLDSHRHNLLHSDSDVAKRYRRILKNSPQLRFSDTFVNRAAEDSYMWNFGDWWSLELPIHGSGWREAEWDVGGIFQRSLAWKIQENSNLYFNFTPKRENYFFRASFPQFVNDQIKPSMRIRLNDSNLIFRWISPSVLEAKVEPDVLRVGINEVNFTSLSDKKHYDLAAQMDWFELNRK